MLSFTTGYWGTESRIRGVRRKYLGRSNLGALRRIGWAVRLRRCSYEYSQAQAQKAASLNTWSSSYPWRRAPGIVNIELI